MVRRRRCPLPQPSRAPPAAPARSASAEEVAHGEVLYSRYCARCHVLGRSVLPDLRRLNTPTHLLFDAIVLGGAYRARGVGSFDDVLSVEDAHAIHAYVIDETRRLKDARARSVEPGSVPPNNEKSSSDEQEPDGGCIWATASGRRDAGAQSDSPRRPLEGEDIFALRWVSDPQIRRDGAMVAYVRHANDETTDREVESIWLVDAASGVEQPLSTQPGSYSSPRWSIDGARVAYLHSARAGDPRSCFLAAVGCHSEITKLDQVPHDKRRLRADAASPSSCVFLSHLLSWAKH